MKIKETINNFKNKGVLKEIKEVPGCLVYRKRICLYSASSYGYPSNLSENRRFEAMEASSISITKKKTQK